MCKKTYWNEEFETLNRCDLEKLQVKRLRKTVGSALDTSFYSKLYEEKGIDVDSIQSVDDIRKLPFTVKQDLRNSYPDGMTSCKKDESIRLHCSSGTTGQPTVVYHNRHDLDSWANLVARSLYCAGARPGDVFQNICGYGLFTGGLGFQYGAETLGALAIPAGAGNSKRQIKLIQDFGTTVIHAIPSYLIRLHEIFLAEGIDPLKCTNLRLFVIGAEPHTEEQRKKIETLFGIKAYNSYGLTEMNGPGVAFECEEQDGLHVWEDAYLVEIVNPDTLEPVEDGEIGELVLTTLDREVMPLIRYRTRDLTRVLPGECACGRTHRRLDRITGRSDDMFIIKGCNVFPMQIESVLMKMPEVGTNYLIELVTENGVDEMYVNVELQAQCFSDSYQDLEKIQNSLVSKIRDEVLAKPKIVLLEPGELPQQEGKAIRVVDARDS
jgi:phenylacetate-CoA ligase